MGHRIEMPKRLQFIAKEFESHRPRTCERKDIQNPATHGEFSFVVDLRLRFVTLRFKPLNEIK